MKKSIFVLLLLGGLSSTSASATDSLRQALGQLQRLLGDGVATPYKAQQRVIVGNLSGNQRKEAVVSFALEGMGGGNACAEYLAIFAENDPFPMAGRTTRPYRLLTVQQVGQRGWRTLNWNTAVVQQHQVHVQGWAWVDGVDAMCCPSRKIEVEFSVDQQNRLIEKETSL